MTTTKATQEALYSKESEMMVLGCMLTNPRAHSFASEIVDETDFYKQEHRCIFSALKEAFASKKHADVHIIAEWLKEKDKLEHVGGVAYLTTLVQYAGTSAYVEEYVDILKEKAIKRKMLSVAERLERDLLSDKSIDEISDRLRKVIEDANYSSQEKPIRLKSIAEISQDYFKHEPPPKPRLLYYTEQTGIKRDFLHKEVTAMLVAEGGRGKTHLLSLLAGCVATGIPFLTEFEIEQPGAVCLVVGENNDADIRRLLYKTHKHLERILDENSKRKDGKQFGLHSENPLAQLEKNLMPVSVHGKNAHFVDANGKPTKFYNVFLNQLKEKEPPDGFQLIILDPASRFSGPEAEKDNAIATSFIACLENITEELKGHPTIMLSHHKSKQALSGGEASQADARGSSGLTDGVRWQANLSKGESNEDSVLEVTKTNLTSYPGKISLKKGKDGIPEFECWLDKRKNAQQLKALF